MMKKLDSRKRGKSFFLKTFKDKEKKINKMRTFYQNEFQLKDRKAKPKQQREVGLFLE